MKDVVSGEAYRKMVHDLTREARWAQRLLNQMIAWLFLATGTTALFFCLWLFKLLEDL